MTRRYIVLLSLLLITACETKGRAMVLPEHLIRTSSENVSFDITNDTSIDSISDWIHEDMPSQAVLSCTEGDMLCADVIRLLDEHQIPFTTADAPQGSASINFTYNRVSAVDCAPQGFGCSASVNAVQMVTNREDFVNPPLSDYPDAEKMVRSYNKSYLRK